jgi:dolichyl-phosphate-mannose--protein O-mannosyl transferase
VCLGAATATKWDGVFWIPAFIVLAMMWDSGARRAAGARYPFDDALLMDTVPGLLAFVVVPVVVYVTSWTGWFLSDGAHAYDHDKYVVAGQSWFSHDWAVLRGWWAYHREIYRFHVNLDSAHPYLSRPYGWLLLARPVAYFYDGSSHNCGASSCSQEVLGVGTPAIWWASILALGTLAWQWIARRDWRAAAIVVTFAAGYLPWFYPDAYHRTMFLFYLLPSVPFMVLAVTMSLGLVLGRARRGARRIIGAAVVGVYLVVVIGNFAWLRPVLMADTLTYSQWHARMLFDESTCDQTKNRNQKHENAPCWI